MVFEIFIMSLPKKIARRHVAARLPPRQVMVPIPGLFSPVQFAGQGLPLRSPRVIDHLELPVTHVFMMRDDEVMDQVIYYLANGRFKRELH